MYRGYRVWELPPNTQGSAVLQMLNMLEGVDLAKAGFGSADHVHWFAEAKKLAFEDLAVGVRRTSARCACRSNSCSPRTTRQRGARS